MMVTGKASSLTGRGRPVGSLVQDKNPAAEAPSPRRGLFHSVPEERSEESFVPVPVGSGKILCEGYGNSRRPIPTILMEKELAREGNP